MAKCSTAKKTNKLLHPALFDLWYVTWKLRQDLLESGTPNHVADGYVGRVRSTIEGFSEEFYRLRRRKCNSKMVSSI